LFGDPRTAAHIGHDLVQIFALDAVRTKNAPGITVFFSGYREQKMFRRNVFILHRFGKLLRRLEYRIRPRSEKGLTAADLWEFLDRCVNFVLKLSKIDADLSEDRPNNTFFFREHRCKQMFRFYMLVLIFFRKRNGFLNCFLAANRKSVKSHCLSPHLKLLCEASLVYHLERFAFVKASFMPKPYLLLRPPRSF